MAGFVIILLYFVFVLTPLAALLLFGLTVAGDNTPQKQN